MLDQQRHPLHHVQPLLRHLVRVRESVQEVYHPGPAHPVRHVHRARAVRARIRGGPASPVRLGPVRLPHPGSTLCNATPSSAALFRGPYFASPIQAPPLTARSRTQQPPKATPAPPTCRCSCSSGISTASPTSHPAAPSARPRAAPSRRRRRRPAPAPGPRRSRPRPSRPAGRPAAAPSVSAAGHFARIAFCCAGRREKRHRARARRPPRAPHAPMFLYGFPSRKAAALPRLRRARRWATARTSGAVEGLKPLVARGCDGRWAARRAGHEHPSSGRAAARPAHRAASRSPTGGCGVRAPRCSLRPERPPMFASFIGARR
jgi:hypothetical protein